MKAVQDKVRAFRELFGQPVGNTKAPAIPADYMMCLDLIKEEFIELSDAAIHDRDVVLVADALVDLIYVTVGFAVSCGVELAPIFDEVHKSNLLKAGGARRSDGKVLKPDGWAPPDVAGCIERQKC